MTPDCLVKLIIACCNRTKKYGFIIPGQEAEFQVTMMGIWGYCDVSAILSEDRDG